MGKVAKVPSRYGPGFGGQARREGTTRQSSLPVRVATAQWPDPVAEL